MAWQVGRLAGLREAGLRGEVACKFALASLVPDSVGEKILDSKYAHEMVCQSASSAAEQVRDQESLCKSSATGVSVIWMFVTRPGSQHLARIY